MTSFSVRNLDDDLHSRLKRRAARRGHSAEAEVRDILRQAFSGETEAGFDDLAADFRALTATRRHTPAEDLLRESRKPAVKTFVVDASVAIKWVIEEPGTKEALRLRRHRLLAPDLLIPECANILWKKVRRKELSSEEAEFAARLLARADTELEPMRALFEQAIKLALALDHPAYDCAYLALAEARGCDFL